MPGAEAVRYEGYGHPETHSPEVNLYSVPGLNKNAVHLQRKGRCNVHKDFPVFPPVPEKPENEFLLPVPVWEAGFYPVRMPE